MTDKLKYIKPILKIIIFICKTILEFFENEEAFSFA